MGRSVRRRRRTEPRPPRRKCDLHPIRSDDGALIRNLRPPLCRYAGPVEYPAKRHSGRLSRRKPLTNDGDVIARLDFPRRKIADANELQGCRRVPAPAHDQPAKDQHERNGGYRAKGFHDSFRILERARAFGRDSRECRAPGGPETGQLYSNRNASMGSSWDALRAGTKSRKRLPRDR